MTRFRLAWLPLLLLASQPCAPAQETATPLPALIQAYGADRGDLASSFDLPGASNRFERLEAFYQDWLARLARIPFATLPESDQIDWLLLKNELESQLTDLARDRRQWAAIHSAVAFREELYPLERARLAGTPVDCRDAAARLDRVVQQVKELRARVCCGSRTNTPSSLSSNAPAPIELSPLRARQAANATDQLHTMLKRWYGFREGYHPEFTWWVKKSYDEADKALDDYAKYLREELAGLKGKEEDPLLGESVGDAELRKALRQEFITEDVAALLALGEQELAWCEKEMRAAARQMGLGEEWKAALAKIKTDFVPPGGQDALIQQLARESIAFVRTHHLVAVPPLCEQTWSLVMIAPETLKTIPYAAYNGHDMMVAYARDTMPLPDKLMTMQGNNRHFTRNVTPHELIPGHHLQRYHAIRERPYRSVFRTPTFVEGWAMYWELRFWELGWARTPEERIGMLFWRMTRAARLIVTLQFHEGRMQPGEMVDFLVARVGHERLGATAEVRRFLDDSFPPLYPACYTLGALQLVELNQEAVRTKRMSEEAFHAAVLGENAIPPPLVRASLLALPLEATNPPAWHPPQPR